MIANNTRKGNKNTAKVLTVAVNKTAPGAGAAVGPSSSSDPAALSPLWRSFGHRTSFIDTAEERFPCTIGVGTVVLIKLAQWPKLRRDGLNAAGSEGGDRTTAAPAPDALS